MYFTYLPSTTPVKQDLVSPIPTTIFQLKPQNSLPYVSYAIPTKELHR